MLDFTFFSPTRFFFGKGMENRAGEAAAAIGSKKVLLHSGGGSAERSGLLARVRQSLAEAGIEYVELAGVVPNPELDLVYTGIELARAENVDLILSAGGGSAADSAKAIAAGVPYDGDVWDFYIGKAQPAKVLPIATIITLAATGSEGSNSSVITKRMGDTVHKRGLNSDLIRPTFSILNPELTYTLPDYQLAAGATDMIVHVLERYITNTADVDLTDRLAEALMQSVMIAAPQALADHEDYASHATLLWAGNLAHNNTVGVGREHDWSSHQIEHEISAYYGATHGAGLAVLVPAFMTYTLSTNVTRYVQFATRVMGVPNDPGHPEAVAREGVRRFRSFLDSLGMPNNLRAFGVKEEDIPGLARGVRRTNGEFVGFFQPLRQEDIENILRLCY